MQSSMMEQESLNEAQQLQLGFGNLALGQVFWQGQQKRGISLDVGGMTLLPPVATPEDPSTS